MPIFVKFRGVDGNKGSKYDKEFTLGNKYHLVASFQITAADAKRWGRVVKSVLQVSAVQTSMVQWKR